MMRAGPLALAAALALAGCTGGSRLENQVIVRLDGDPADIAGAQRVADATCERRGGRARFLALVYEDMSLIRRDTTRPPDAVFACDPLR